MVTSLLLLVFLLIVLAFFLKKKKTATVVTSIHIYPIKSCGPMNLTSVKVNSLGMYFDREWAIVTSTNQLVTQGMDASLIKLIPKLITTDSEVTSIELSFDEHSFKFTPEKSGENIKFECKSVQCEGVVEGPEVNEFLQKVFKKEYKLVRMGKGRQMNQHPKYSSLVADDFKTGFVNSAQFLVISQESFELTKSSLPEQKRRNLDIEVFRANVIVSGCKPFEEETWSRFQIGEVEFQGIGRCTRCKITTVIPKTLEYDPDFEPVSTLRKINGNGTKGYLGMHCVRLCDGELKTGQPVLVKQTKKFPDI